MAERCPACNAFVDDNGIEPGGSLRCDRCGMRFPKPRRAPATPAAAAARIVGAHGLHPALERKYARPDEVAAPPQAPKPLAGGDARVVAGEAGTEPGRPNARRSMDGPALAPPVGAPAASTRAAAPATPPKLDRHGEPMPTIDGYDMIELVGKGAMGRVYRARQTTTGRMAAIKTLAPELAARQDFVQRFEREGAAMRAVQHPGVVSVFDQGQAGPELFYIAMEFIEGHPLRKSLERGALPVEQALRFTRLILQALDAAHKPGVIHRDLKPENILVTGAPGRERLVLVDFGLAGIIEEENDPHPNLTKSRMTMGTVNYMAPEQRTDAKRVDQRADVYAAGVILYELLTGDLPLGRFAAATEKVPTLPRAIDTVIDTALARSQETRYQNAREFDAALARIEGDARAATHNDTVVGRARASEPMRSPLAPPAGAQAVPSQGIGLDPRGGAPRGGGDLRRVSVHETHVEDAPPAAALAAGGGGTLVDHVEGPAWVTALPHVKPRTLWAGIALVVGTVVGLLALRGGIGG